MRGAAPRAPAIDWTTRHRGRAGEGAQGSQGHRGHLDGQLGPLSPRGDLAVPGHLSPGPARQLRPLPMSLHTGHPFGQPAPVTPQPSPEQRALWAGAEHDPMDLPTSLPRPPRHRVPAEHPASSPRRSIPRVACVGHPRPIRLGQPRSLTQVRQGMAPTVAIPGTCACLHALGRSLPALAPSDLCEEPLLQRKCDAWEDDLEGRLLRPAVHRTNGPCNGGWRVKLVPRPRCWPRSWLTSAFPDTLGAAIRDVRPD